MNGVSDMAELISVIMSTYNEQEEWVRRSIESILEQSYQKIEFIIVLDKPENMELRKVLEEYAGKDNRIHLLINERNMGLVDSLNRALTEAQGTLVARMDADDISYSQRLEKEYRALKKNQADFVMGAVDYIDEFDNVDTRTFEKAYFGKKFERIEKFGNISAHPTWLVRKEVYDHLKGYRHVECCEDVDFLLRAIQEGFLCMRISDHILQYRMRKSGVSRSRALEQFVRMRYIRGVYRKNKRLSGVTAEDWNRDYRKVTEKQKRCFEQAMRLLWEGKKFFSEHRYLKCAGNICIGMLKSGYFIQYIADNLIWMIAVKIF